MAQAASPEKLAQEGKAAYQRGDFLNAAHTFEAARVAYQAVGDLLTAAEMANNCSVAYLKAGEGASALAAVEGTAEIFAQAGDLRRQGMALSNRAAALEALERYEEAIQGYQLSADILQQAGEDQLRAQTMQSLSMLQFNIGRQLQALATMQAGLEGVRRPTPKQSFLKRLLNIPIEMITRRRI
jgi:tetratricopeptide (TPR) repeat protein